MSYKGTTHGCRQYNFYFRRLNQVRRTSFNHFKGNSKDKSTTRFCSSLSRIILMTTNIVKIISHVKSRSCIHNTYHWYGWIHTHENCLHGAPTLRGGWVMWFLDIKWIQIDSSTNFESVIWIDFSRLLLQLSHLIKFSIKSLDSVFVSELLSSCGSLDYTSPRANRSVMYTEVIIIVYTWKQEKDITVSQRQLFCITKLFCL